MEKLGFADSADQDKSAMNVQSDLWLTLCAALLYAIIETTLK